MLTWLPTLFITDCSLVAVLACDALALPVPWQPVQLAV